MKRCFSDINFDTKKKIAAVPRNANLVVSLMTNFEETKIISTVERKTEDGRKQAKIPVYSTSYNKYKNGVDLFD